MANTYRRSVSTCSNRNICCNNKYQDIFLFYFSLQQCDIVFFFIVLFNTCVNNPNIEMIIKQRAVKHLFLVFATMIPVLNWYILYKYGRIDHYYLDMQSAFLHLRQVKLFVISNLLVYLHSMFSSRYMSVKVWSILFRFFFFGTPIDIWRFFHESRLIH
jgi:hypothetical protein